MHKEIISLIVEESKKQNLTHDFAEGDHISVCRLLFQNYRKEKGLRLTTTGNAIMSNLFAHYNITLPENFKMLPRHLLFLERFMKFPYYYDKGILVVYDPSIGVQLKFVDGDIDKLIQSKKAIKDWKI